MPPVLAATETSPPVLVSPRISRMRRPPAIAAWAVALVLACLAGCSSSSNDTPEPVTATQENLTKIGRAYVKYTKEKGRPPKNVDELKPLLAKSGDPDTILVSDRDHLPLVICWGADTRGSHTWAKSVPVLAYEKEGQGGSRYVLLFQECFVQLMSEKQFREASFPPGHTPEF